MVEGKQQQQQQATAAAAGLTSSSVPDALHTASERGRERERAAARLWGLGLGLGFRCSPIWLGLSPRRCQQPATAHLIDSGPRPTLSLCPQRLGLVGPTQRRRSQPALPACCWRGGAGLRGSRPVPASPKGLMRGAAKAPSPTRCPCPAAHTIPNAAQRFEAWHPGMGASFFSSLLAAVGRVRNPARREERSRHPGGHRAAAGMD